MKKNMIIWFVTMFTDKMTPEEIKHWIDMGIDMVEDKVAASPSTLDDAIVLPMCNLLRKALSIPDNDEVEDVPTEEKENA